jgi:hypothetical protein
MKKGIWDGGGFILDFLSLSLSLSLSVCVCVCVCVYVYHLGIDDIFYFKGIAILSFRSIATVNV